MTHPTEAGSSAAPSAPPTEVDGWRVVQDPHNPAWYWRCRALMLEWNCWWQGDWGWPTWRVPLHRPADTLGYSSYVGDSTPEREALWAALFVNP